MNESSFGKNPRPSGSDSQKPGFSEEVFKLVHEEAHSGDIPSVIRNYQRIIRAYQEELSAKNRTIEELEEQREALIATSETDDLTGLLNRRGYERSIERYAEYREETAVMTFLDLDGFGKVNKQHGHAAGDRTIVGVARAIQSQMRPDDIITRLSGGADEFIILWNLSHSLSDEQKAEIIKKKEHKLQVAISLVHQEGASLGSAMMEYPMPEDLVLPNGEEGGILFQEATTKSYEAKSKRRALARVAFGQVIDPDNR